MRKYSPLVLLFIFLPVLLSAQDSVFNQKSRNWGLKLSGSHNVLRDDYHMPLNNVGAGLTAGIFYEKINKRTLQTGNFALHFAMLKDKLGFESIYSYPNLRYAYLWQTSKDSNTRIKLYAGPMAEAQYNIYYFLQTDDSHVRWLTQYSFGLQSIAEIKIFQRKRLRLSGSLPFIQFHSRMPREILHSNFNPAFGKFMSMLHSNSQFLLSTSGFRFSASMPVIETQKNILSLGYEHFQTTYRYLYIQTNSLTVTWTRKK